MKLLNDVALAACTQLSSLHKYKVMLTNKLVVAVQQAEQQHCDSSSNKSAYPLHTSKNSTSCGQEWPRLKVCLMQVS